MICFPLHLFDLRLFEALLDLTHKAEYDLILATERSSSIASKPRAVFS